ncbi:hypothetical protein P4C99_14190 [Pontiellaceae bacterium B1224]|nr:hypothetical protein [Pontiellaceae bacterium B1224]
MNRKPETYCRKMARRWLFELVLIVMAGVSVAAPPKIDLTGVMQNQNGSVAYIDGQLRYIGDEVSGFEIISIQNSGIQVKSKSGQEIYFVSLSTSAGVREVSEGEIHDLEESNDKLEEGAGGVTVIHEEMTGASEPSHEPLKEGPLMTGMVILSLSLLGLGFLISTVGSIWYIVACFQESIWWGLGALFVPLVELIFLFVHWERAKKPFLISLLGTGLAFVSVLITPEFFESIQQ